MPGIGEKTAERLALHLATQQEDEDILTFSKDLANLKENIKTCSTCGMLADHDPCPICQDETRDQM